MTFLQQVALLFAKRNIRRGICPECHSESPARETCVVCDSYREHYGTFEHPPSIERRGRWLLRWMDRNT